MARTIGIDLGTTYSAVSVMSPSGTPEIVRNREGEDITPSVVMFQSFDDRDEPLVGTMAKNQAVMFPKYVVDYIKRQMGDPYWRYDSESGHSYTPEEVSALILRRLKEDAELALGEPVTRAVITVPAYFDDARRTATKDAGHIAGLEVLRILNEPTAAALSFGIATSSEGITLVYDLGGGTFDVTLMKITDGTFDVIGTDGDSRLGGFDFDNRLIDFIAGKVQEMGGPDLADQPGDLAMLRERAEIAKRSLTSVTKTTVHVSVGGRPFGIQIQRSEFEEITTDLLDRTKDFTESVLQRANTTWDEIDHVLLVGGSTRMPMVRTMLERISGKMPDLSVHPDLAVALGAAIQAAAEDAKATGGAHTGSFGRLLPGKPLKIADVSSQSLGVLLLDQSTRQLRNTVVIPRNSKVPAKFSVQAETSVDYQDTVLIQVVEGDNPDPDLAKEIGSKDIPIPRYQAGAPIIVTYSYDIDQTIDVEVTDLTTNQPLGSFQIDRLANLNENQRALAAAHVGALSVQ